MNGPKCLDGWRQRFCTCHLEAMVTLEIHFIYQSVGRGLGVTSLLKTRRAERLALVLLCYRYRPSWEVFSSPPPLSDTRTPPPRPLINTSIAAAHLSHASRTRIWKAATPTSLPSPASREAQRLVSLYIKRSLCFHLERRIEPAPPLSECVGVLLSSRNLGGAKYSALTATRCTIRAT